MSSLSLWGRSRRLRPVVDPTEVLELGGISKRLEESKKVFEKKRAFGLKKHELADSFFFVKNGYGKDKGNEYECNQTHRNK